MKRHLCFAALALCTFTLANCASEPPVIHEHHYYHTTTTRYTKPSASVSGYSKPAGVSSSSPEGFEAVTPPSSYSR
jgi:hypothetical protein